MLIGHATVLLVENMQQAARPNHEVIPPDMFDVYFWADDVDAMHTEFQHRSFGSGV